MIDYVIPTLTVPSLAVAHTDARFPIRRVFCVGRNYAAHAREMGNDPTREPPFFFMKPADAVVPAEGVLPYPPLTSNLHHEVEMVVALGCGATNIEPSQALSLVWGYGVGLDMTRRDFQDIAKKMSRPWDEARAFDASAPCSPLHPVTAIGHPASGCIWLNVNGTVRQEGDLADMIWSVADVISHISRSIALAAGDLIFTGTPAGVGVLNPGDHLSAGIDGLAQFALEVGPKSIVNING